jgi:Uma2 family endonuclease
MEKTEEALMTLDEFMELYADEGPFELVDGERIPMSPQVMMSVIIAGNIYFLLRLYLSSHPIGTVFSEAPIALTKERKWVKGSRVPDVMFVTAERLTVLVAEDPDWKYKPLTIVPDLAVEVMSPTDKATDLDKKIVRYLQDGVRLIWLVKPETQTVQIYVQGSKQQTTLGIEDMLTGGDVIPGFEVSIAKLFE